MAPPTELGVGEQLTAVAVRHDLAVVMTPDCDLIWDFAARFETDVARAALSPEASDIETKVAAVPHVLLCEAYEEADARGRVQETKLWKLLQQNRDERYHHFSAAAIGEGDDVPTLADVYLDFKKPFAIATTQLYAGVRVEGVRRVARVPSPYLYDLIQRFYSYLARVAVPAP